MIRVSNEFFHKPKKDADVHGIALEMDQAGLKMLYELLVEAKRQMHERSVEQKPPATFVVSTPWVCHDSGAEMHQLKIHEE
jgi:hypothetical protein